MNTCIQIYTYIFSYISIYLFMHLYLHLSTFLIITERLYAHIPIFVYIIYIVRKHHEIRNPMILAEDEVR